MSAQLLNETVLGVCDFLQRRPERTLESPVGTEKAKRASVAIIIAWRTSEAADYSFMGDDAISTIDQLRDQPWLRHAEPHILFIKRAKREGDRWNNQYCDPFLSWIFESDLLTLVTSVALPGGRREPGESDQEAARRETFEEVGLHLTAGNSIFVGGLDQRQVTTSFGSVFLMTLCPYVYVMTQPGLPTLALQVSEVESAHWIGVAKLLNSANRSYEYVDVSSRLARGGGAWGRKFMLHAFGMMRFCAIELKPSVSVPENTKTKLLMWGLTLGVLTDFLNLLPPHDAEDLWQYPTFTAPDVDVILSLLGSRTRRRIASGPGKDALAGTGADVPLDFVGRAIEPWYPNVPLALMSAVVLRVAVGVALLQSIRRFAR